ncbi:MAG TPA: hypothetical protein VFV71_09790 [Burkholderiales bacterium]|nr:hypothetical protein [Burkholderiales bacterium]
MRMEHVLLVGSMILTVPTLAADPRPASRDDSRPDTGTSPRASAGTNLMASEELRARPARRNRVRYTFPPPARRM